MVKKDVIPAEGVVEEALPNATFRVKVEKGDENLIGKQVLATLAGKMRIYHIRVLPGDLVKLEISTYDQSRGRITFRYK